MKKQLILTLVLLVSIFSFAQKKELKTLEKAVKNNNYAEAKATLTQLEPMLSGMDEEMKSKFYFNKGKAYFANGSATNKDVMVAVESLSKVTDNGYTSELAELKQQMENDLLQKANDNYVANKFKEAALGFENLYDLSESDQSYLYYAAVSAISAQDYDLALKHYLKLKELGYTGVETQYFAISKETGEEEVLTKETRDLYVNKLKTHISPGERQTDSKVAEITKTIASIYINQGKSEEALAAIKEARAADPDDTTLIITEANTQYQLGNKEAYAALIKEATAKEPNNKDLLYNLGVLSSEAGDAEQAKTYYEKVIQLDPNYVNALTNLAAVILGEEASVIEEMNGLGNSVADNRRYDELKAKRGQIYKEAIPYLQSVLQIDESNKDVARTLMNIYGAINEDAKFKALKEKYNF